MSDQHTNLGFGAVYPSQEDIRDIHVENVARSGLPLQADSRDYSMIVHDNQRAIGICTAADVADMLTKFWYEKTGEIIYFSEQFIYNVGKRIYDKNYTEGSSIKTMLEVVRNYGAPPKSLVPTDDTHEDYETYVHQWFDQSVFDAATKYKIPGYAKVRLDPVGFASDFNANPYGIQTRMSVGDNFYTDKDGNITWDGAKLNPLKAPNPVDGGHSIKVVAYSGIDKNQRRTMRNSWGDNKNPTNDQGAVWGNNGDLDYIYSTQAPYVTEAWVFTPVDPKKNFTYTFAKDLHYGMTNADVVALQRVLTNMGFFPSDQPATGYYGLITAKAVYNFQVANNVDTPQNLVLLQGTKSVFGPKSRSVINNLQNK